MTSSEGMQVPERSSAQPQRGRAPSSRPQRRREPDGAGPERLARALGWLSIGLGVAEVVAPRRLARAIGIGDTPKRRLLLRALGVREIASGAGILAGRRPGGWLWSRVGGDAIDLGLLGRAMQASDADTRRVVTATAAVAGVTALDLYASERMSRQDRGVRVERSITVLRPADEIYRYWRTLENLPRFLRHLESVRVIDDRRSHWRARGPAGTSVEWDAEIVDDQPNARIAWRSLEGATVPNAGAVRFFAAPGGRGTEIHVELEYDPPAGTVGAAIAKLFGEEPGQQIAGDLRRLKQRLETGDVVTAKGPAARTRASRFGGRS